MSKGSSKEIKEHINSIHNQTEKNELNSKGAIITADFNSFSKNTNRTIINNQTSEIDLYAEPGEEKLNSKQRSSVKAATFNNFNADSNDSINSKTKHKFSKTTNKFLEDKESLDNINSNKEIKEESKDFENQEYKKFKTNFSVPMSGLSKSKQETLMRINSSRINITPSGEMHSLNNKLDNNMFEEVKKRHEDQQAIILTEPGQVHDDQSPGELNNSQLDNEDDINVDFNNQTKTKQELNYILNQKKQSKI